MDGIKEIRHRLHRHPEISGEECNTAKVVAEALQAAGVDDIITGIGGYGIAGIFSGVADGPTLMFRSELDALPIREVSNLPYRSQIPGKAYLCGHDGHSAILLPLLPLWGKSAQPAAASY